MDAAETRALWRAVALLLLVSLLRWGWARARPAEAAPGTSVLPELVESVEEATADQTRRARPLGEERIDPNRAPEAELDRLPGVGPAVARAIVAARDDGAVFRRPEDLGVVRGVGPGLVARMRPFLDFGAPPAPRRSPPRDARAAAPSVVDLNRADPAELATLPGVGPALARRIVERRRQRPFGTVDDLLDVKGIGPATLERLRPRVGVGPGR